MRRLRLAWRLCLWWRLTMLYGGILAGQSSGAVPEKGIPVTDSLVIAKCGSCHARDPSGNMQRISWARTTPEGWQNALKQMIRRNGLSITPAEARPIVRYLSTRHGLAPEEAAPVMYEAERRIYEETNIPNDNLRQACVKCHSFARVLSWRRSAEDWKQFADSHAATHKFSPNEEAVAFIARAAPLHTPEWNAWSSREGTPNLAGRWLVTASVNGRGKYYGEMQVERESAEEFTTRVDLTSVRDGTHMIRTGRGAQYAGYAWRGRSKGSDAAGSAADDLASEVREVLWFAPDEARAKGRWFWGQYQEFGFDVELKRASNDATLLLVDRASLKAGSRASRIRLIGDKFPAAVTPADLTFGPGVTVRGIVSHTPSEVVAEIDVAADAPLGKRGVAFRGSVLPEAMAIYDRVDYVKVTPESAVAAFGDRDRQRGYQQFEAIGYQRGPDGKARTADDVNLGPVDATWSMQMFHAADGESADFIGTVSPSGLFVPASENPNNNFDVWVIATARNEKNPDGKPLVGKSYLVVTIPTYTFNGRKYVRDLDRWVDDGPEKKQ